MDGWKLLVGGDIGLMSLATIAPVLVIGLGLAGFYKKMAEEYVQHAK